MGLTVWEGPTAGRSVSAWGFAAGWTLRCRLLGFMAYRGGGL